MFSSRAMARSVTASVPCVTNSARALDLMSPSVLIRQFYPWRRRYQPLGGLHDRYRRHGLVPMQRPERVALTSVVSIVGECTTTQSMTLSQKFTLSGDQTS